MVKPNLRSKLEFKPLFHFWPTVVTVESSIRFMNMLQAQKNEAHGFEPHFRVEPKKRVSG
jgi:hypothetical protein